MLKIKQQARTKRKWTRSGGNGVGVGVGGLRDEKGRTFKCSGISQEEKD